MALTGAVIAAVTAVFYFLASYAPLFLGWVDINWADVGNIPVRSRWMISLIAGQLIGILFVFFRFLALQRARVLITQEFRRSVEAHLTYYDWLYTTINDDSIDNDVALLLISERSRTHSIFLCSRIAEIFQIHTNCSCHSTIKTFNPEDMTVTTRIPDALLHNGDRIVVHEQLNDFSYKQNTAFTRIIDDAAVDYYLNNHLRISNFIGRYENANHDWQKYYRATIVMPLTDKKSSARITATSVIGFLCVDNICGRFNRRYAKAVLSVFVIVITDMMIKLGEIQPVSERNEL